MSQAQTAEVKALAWFKLSEFISRGEKERAFGAYKVLVLSFDNKAFCLLIEGDLLSIFGEAALANEKYLEAAKIYESLENYFLASIAYNSYLQNSKCCHILNKLCEIYSQLKFKPKVISSLRALFRFYLENKNKDAAEECLKKLCEYGDCLKEEEEWAFFLLNENKNTKETLANIGKVIENLFTKGESKELQKFLGKLETLDAEAYKNAINKMRDSK